MAMDINHEALSLSEAYVDTFTFPPFLAAFEPPTAIRCLPLPTPLPPPPPVSCDRLTSAATVKPRSPRNPDVGAATCAPIPPCIECGKRFNSPKALYGHMRCHPNRPYRGMNPRSPLLFAVPKMVAPKFTDEEYEVARSLLLLAKTNSRGKEICIAPVRKKRARMKALGKRSRYCVELENKRGGSCCTSISKSCEWDLNLPPPLDDGELSPSSSSYSHLDLNLRI